ncbi:hypothetical protein RN2511_036140 [Rhodococcus sp. NKCM2511]|uniref:hypothetical protein n=1 Tax=Rhodococcus sp. NKCM2511 TaxID=2766011 RepID=UPI001910AB34|nr:hypothetical protein [Rhodococcus sp. NKCM2511]GHP18878.1 hypothetical protein RN2511_036140 [Rhodococcus sp. NKCM2511]
MTTPTGSGEYKFHADRVRAMQFTPESFSDVIDWLRENGRALGSYSNASRPYRLDLPKPYRLENSREYIHFKAMADRARRQSLASHEGEREIGRKALKDIEAILSNLVQSIKNSGWPVDYPLMDDSDA